MPRRKRIDLEDYDFQPVPDDALEAFPGAAPANIVKRSAYIRDFTEPDADVSGFGDASGLGDVPEESGLQPENKFSTVGSKSYQRADYAPPGGKRPVIAEFARPDSRYGIDPRGSDFGFPNAPVEFEWSGFDGLSQRGFGGVKLIGNVVRQLIKKGVVKIGEAKLAVSALHDAIRGRTAEVSAEGFRLLQRIAPRLSESVAALRKG